MGAGGVMLPGAGSSVGDADGAAEGAPPRSAGSIGATGAVLPSQTGLPEVSRSG
jgi:hypothetical protein